jgi:adenylylsulfate kinase-like enzyme
VNPTDLAPPISLPLGLRWGPARDDPATIWITGPSGAGVAAIGRAVHSALTSAGRQAALVDDEVAGLTRDSRAERARRAADAAAALVEDGLIAIVVVDSPHVRDRELARLAHEARDLPFFEVFVNTSANDDPVGRPTQRYEVPPLPDLVLFPGPVIASLAAVIALL